MGTFGAPLGHLMGSVHRARKKIVDGWPCHLTSRVFLVIYAHIHQSAPHLRKSTRKAPITVFLRALLHFKPKRHPPGLRPGTGAAKALPPSNDFTACAVVRRQRCVRHVHKTTLVLLLSPCLWSESPKTTPSADVSPSGKASLQTMCQATAPMRACF